MKITDSLVRLDADIATPDEAIRAAGQLLVDDGSVDTEYVDAMVEAFHDLGPYSVIAPGIAMPHARPTTGVEREAFAVLRLAVPIAFGHPYNDPVRLVIPLAGRNSKSHVHVLRRLSSVLMDPATVNILRTTDDAADVTALFTHMEE